MKKKSKKNQKKEFPILIVVTVLILVVLISSIVIESFLGKELTKVTIQKNLSTAYSTRILDRLETNNENVLLSDLTLNPSLTILYKYGNEKVQEEMKPYFELTPEELVENYNKIYQRYEKAYKIVDYGNSFWIHNKGNAVSKEVKDTAKKELHFEILEKDFTKNSTVDAMNRWVNSNTHGKIKGNFKQVQIQNLSSMLMGTLYFHEEWDEEYEDEDIEDGTFSGNKGKETVTYLKSTESTYYENDQAKGFMKSYKHEGLSFIGIIPKENNSLKNINLEELLKTKQNAEVLVKIPEFKFTYEMDLVKPLQEMGIKSIFKSGNLDNITKNLYVSEIKQKNFINVDRSGTEAASLTYIGMETRGIATEVKTVYLDQPFIFMIYDNTIDQVLFMGRVNYIKE